MNRSENCDVVILGGGPAGLAAAISSHSKGAKTLIVEREQRTGGILKQCIHDGFGLVRFKEKLAGPEYARKFIDIVESEKIPVMYETFVSKLSSDGNGFTLVCVNKEKGVFEIHAKSVVAATGCRERTDRQVFIHGERPAGVFTAGLAQYLVNIQGWLPGKKCVILGSGDIGLIMARRLKLEGMEVEGVYELKNEPSGLSRNIRQCLYDFNIPLHLSTTVAEVHGDKRLTGVTVAKVDNKGKIIEGSQKYIECDTLILSVGLIPENDLLSPLGIDMDPATKGPRVDQTMQTSLPGLFSCGNALHVNDLVDYVSESGETAGLSAATFVQGKKETRLLVSAGSGFLSVVPQFINIDADTSPIVYFRVRSTLTEGAEIAIKSGDTLLFKKKYSVLRPPEMERVELDLEAVKKCTKGITVEMIKKEDGAHV